MLIRFAVTNLLSFKERVEFTMIASSERIHPHHVYRTASRNHPNLVRAAVVYGANSAGKSNFVQAIKTLRQMVVRTWSPETLLPIKRFKLNPSYIQIPSEFEIEFRTQGINYLYSVSATPNVILQERLATTTNSGEKLLFHRTTDSDRKVSVEWGRSFEQIPSKDKQFLDFVCQGTRPNQLFLRESIERNMDYFRDPYMWFRKSLSIIEPTATYRALESRLETDEAFRNFLARVMNVAGTGITDIQMHDVDIHAVEDLPQTILEEIRENMTSDRSVSLRNNLGLRLFITQGADELRAAKLMTIHRDQESATEVSFDINEESDGTQRLFDLVPMLYDLMAEDKQESVYIVDEIGRSLHPHLTGLIFNLHLDEAYRNQSSQLIATTHETNLLDLSSLRRDEIWFVEKRNDGSSDLYSLVDFQPRYDKDVQHDYLLGRYGGIPFIGNVHRLRLPTSKHQEV
ncbi:AAA family ATPase [Candidatus Viridilinea mediisalina]|uniref:ATPase AAA-type core domain-containing protein n=1 Tax=Candidatus Viridilinea mediisalina TaxID=2024553 RepID=A0A2A6RKG1_9CHLR|nr:AAA family ATPase [Candidatus Viridilinea mediisalina]PDW03360.1 hypothetical protein CJ255_09245 [Candidatus Viridilinea mediisalina]